VQGASALNRVLQKVPGPIEAFAVWEPVLPTDLFSPRTDTLAGLSDPRAWQLWDRHHVMSDAMRAGMLAHPSKIPVTAQRQHGRADGILWDAVAVFPAGARWEQTLPAPTYLDGDVVEITSGLQRVLEAER
jgi:hypothetical protein